MNRDVHPAEIDETAEAYLMGRMIPEDATAFEDHCIICWTCAERLQAAEEFRFAMRRAALGLSEADAVKTPDLQPIAQSLNYSRRFSRLQVW
jgi:hypothetical protein